MRRLRITGGTMKGQFINLNINNNKVRHTSSKVRESIFNMLGDITGKKIIDLFSGSGILAFEAISRNASHATAVEIERAMAKKIREIIDSLNLKEVFLVLNMDVFDAIPYLNKSKAVFDIIFMDPPYDMGYIAKTLKAMEEHVIFNKDTIFIIESSKREQIKHHLSERWFIIKEKIYGDTVVSILKSGLFNKN